MNDENTEYHESTEKVDTSQYDLYPYTSLPDVPPPPPPKQRNIFKILFIVVLVLLIGALSGLVFGYNYMQSQSKVLPTPVLRVTQSITRTSGITAEPTPTATPTISYSGVTADELWSAFAQAGLYTSIPQGDTAWLGYPAIPEHGALYWSMVPSGSTAPGDIMRVAVFDTFKEAVEDGQYVSIALPATPGNPNMVYQVRGACLLIFNHQEVSNSAILQYDAIMEKYCVPLTK